MLPAGSTLAVPLAPIPWSAHAHDVGVVLGGNATCGGNSLGTASLALDGTPGTPTTFGVLGYPVYRWVPVPKDPKALTVTLEGADCAFVSLYLVDGQCEADNPGPGCPL